MKRAIHAAFLLLLPIVVAAFGLSALSAVLLVIAALLWRWALLAAAMLRPYKGPKIVLDSMTMSHFVEKVRWCLDRLGIDYTERASAAVVGALFAGRTVPRLRLRTGLVESSIGNSPQILRYLWGEYSVPMGEAAAFLEPTAGRAALEKRIDRYGVDLQVWVYYHLLLDRELTLHSWGANSPHVPAWQRAMLPVVFPLLAAFIKWSFSINDEHYAKAVQNIEHLLADMDTRLADGRHSLLGGDETNYVDIAFAAMSGLWMQPAAYGGDMGTGSRIARNRMPAPMRADTERWLEDYPKAAAFVTRLYAEERMPNEEGES